MCGIFGIIGNESINPKELDFLVKQAEQRGKDSSGLLVDHGNYRYQAYRADDRITKLLAKVDIKKSKIALGHSRLVTNGLGDNQPVVGDDACVFHNGIIVNADSLWKNVSVQRKLEIDTEIISAIASEEIKLGHAVEKIAERVLAECEGVVACSLFLPAKGKILLFSNNGSLYLGKKGSTYYYSSEAFPLTEIGCADIKQIYDVVVLDVPASVQKVEVSEIKEKPRRLIGGLGTNLSEAKLLEYPTHNLRRCTRCILPETMPFIHFDHEGVCNYCRHYKPRNRPKPVDELKSLLEPYRRKQGNECIVPFSGGRDSCYGLHLVTKELGMKAVTYTYDWGMVTDLGRRNISRMCAKLGVENIIVADDITKKRENIRKNFLAWLKSPHLGMVSILTAGDKHFFRHVETVKMQTGISLNLWGVNPLEVTHFKAGFLGVPPDFEETLVYNSGLMQQLRYQKLRFGAMLKSPGYFNSSLWDTLSGEYYRSFHKKEDYYHIFDYWRWDEKQIDDTLLNEYDWEKAPDTNTTWRIGDGTAAIYNYIYYTVAGFTEHDTFRSNQVREGDITREQALALVTDENQPRYPNIKWYLDAIGLDFNNVIPVINKIPRLFN